MNKKSIDSLPLSIQFSYIITSYILQIIIMAKNFKLCQIQIQMFRSQSLSQINLNNPETEVNEI